jgi:methyl-accepting chemotaxis protein
MTLSSDVRFTIDNWITIVDEDQIALGRQVGDTKNMDEVVYMAVQVKDKQYFDKFRGQIKTFKDRERQVIPPV